MSDLETLLTPVTSFLVDLGLEDPVAAEKALEDRFPPGGEAWTRIASETRRSLEIGGICDRGEAPVRYSRIVKPGDASHGFSVDAVLLESADGPGHTHPRGEVSLCLVQAGQPEFDGRPDPTWVALPPGSSHVPTVRNGSILFLYWWPGGEVVWE